MSDSLLRAVERLTYLEEQWHENKSPVWGTSTGFPSIDDVTGGLHPGEVSIIAARTSHGKSTLQMQIAFSVVVDLYAESLEVGESVGKVIVVSPEMSTEAILTRQASIASGVPPQLIKRGLATEEQRSRWLTELNLLSELRHNLDIYAGKSIDIADVKAITDTTHTSQTPVKLLVIDYIQRLSAGFGNKSSYDRATYISGELKDLANSYDLPVLASSQMNRAVMTRGKDEKERMPELHDLRDSGRIEEDADSVWILWRPGQFSKEAPMTARQEATLHIAKNRDGQTGVIPLHFQNDLVMFHDLGVDRISLDGGRVRSDD